MRDLKAAGLIDARPGSGTFVTDSLQARLANRADASGLHRHIDQLIDDSHALGIRSTELVALISARRLLSRQHWAAISASSWSGSFPRQPPAMPASSRRGSARRVTVEPLTIAAHRTRADAAKARANSADLVVTFANRHREVAALVPNTKVVSISFMPSEETRMALALARPAGARRRRVALPGFPADHEGRRAALCAACARASRRHRSKRRVLSSCSPDASVVVYATGAESVLRTARPKAFRLSNTAMRPTRAISSGSLFRSFARRVSAAAGRRPDTETVGRPRQTERQSGEGDVVRISDMNWQQVEAYLKTDDRAILPLGSTEQHAQLSLSVDSILAEKVALDAAEPLGIPVFPVVAYGVTPYFLAYPGTISLRIETYVRIVRDILDGLQRQGFRRILIVNGHGGNQPAGSLAIEWMADNPGTAVKFHNWWNAPKTFAKVQEIDPVASHASWMENFPWTRLAERGTRRPSRSR